MLDKNNQISLSLILNDHLNPPPPHSTGRRFRYAHGDLYTKSPRKRRPPRDLRTCRVQYGLRFFYASLRFCYDPTRPVKIWLRLVYADGDVAATLLRPWRWSYAFVALLYPFNIESEILIRFYYDLGASTALLPFLLRFVWFWPKFRIVAESPSSGMGV